LCSSLTILIDQEALRYHHHPQHHNMAWSWWKGYEKKEEEFY
jgi:hypothetical protein